jgi:hypothetical protein
MAIQAKVFRRVSSKEQAVLFGAAEFHAAPDPALATGAVRPIDPALATFTCQKFNILMRIRLRLQQEKYAAPAPQH